MKPATTFEFLMLMLIGVCIWDAKKNKGWIRAYEIFVSIIYGVLLEISTVRVYGAYYYGKDFLLMIGDVPLSIGLGWAIILYSVIEYTENLSLKPWTRALCNAFIALNIDLSMDAIAIRLGFWNWPIPFQQDWYGVIYGNFFGWFEVVLLYSFYQNLMLLKVNSHKFKKNIGSMMKVAIPMFTVILSMLTLIPVLSIWTEVVKIIMTLWFQGEYSKSGEILFTSFFIPVIFITIILLFKECRTEKRIFLKKTVAIIPFVVPLCFHGFFIFYAITFGFFAKLPDLLTISVSMLIISIIVYMAPWISKYLTWAS